jgi:hypothetical protein
MCSNKVAMSWKLVGTLVCVAALVIAATTVGNVSSAGSIKINQTVVPATAATSVPIVLGDQVSANESETVIRMEKCAVLTLEPRSSVKTGESQGKPFVRLVAGTLHYKLTDACIAIFKQNQPVPNALDGVVSIVSHKTPIILATAGGAAAVIGTVALVRRSPSCPPGQTCP